MAGLEETTEKIHDAFFVDLFVRVSNAAAIQMYKKVSLYSWLAAQIQTLQSIMVLNIDMPTTVFSHQFWASVCCRIQGATLNFVNLTGLTSGLFANILCMSILGNAQVFYVQSYTGAIFKITIWHQADQVICYLFLVWESESNLLKSNGQIQVSTPCGSLVAFLNKYHVKL